MFERLRSFKKVPSLEMIHLLQHVFLAFQTNFFFHSKNLNHWTKSKVPKLQQRRRHWKHLSTFPRGYVDVLTRHTHMVSRKLHHHLSSVHLTSTVCWLKKERKKDWLRASFTGQSRHWSVSFLGKKTNKQFSKKKKKNPKKKIDV